MRVVLFETFEVLNCEVTVTEAKVICLVLFDGRRIAINSTIYYKGIKTDNNPHKGMAVNKSQH